MNMHANAETKNPALAMPDGIGAAQLALPPLPKRLNAIDTPWPNMPDKMLIVIDGWDHTPKWLVGSWVADALGGLLITASDVFCALVVAARLAGVDTKEHVCVANWCKQASVQIGFERAGGRSYEAQIGVNGKWFLNADHEFGFDSTRAVSDTFWDKVREVLRQCDFDDRVVIVSSDACRDFPGTPYKFFIDDTDRNYRESIDRGLLSRPWIGAMRNYPYGVTCLDTFDETLLIDSTRCSEADQVMLVLVECAVRAFENGLIQGDYFGMLRGARATANAVRREMERVIAEENREEETWWK